MPPLPSLWASTAEPAPETPPLDGEHRADVAVIGAGFTGLACALRLAEGGAGVVVVDAEAPGFGASGRNGGQVIPGLKLDPDALDRLYGEETTDFVGKAADTTFALIARLGIDCAARRDGWVQASVKRSHLATLEARASAWARRGAAVDLLDTAAMARATGAEGFAGGWIDRRAGSLHPLSYARGLARAAQAAGASVHGGSRVTRLRRDGKTWRAETARGSILAEQVLLATNGYTDALWPGLRATLIPANSFQIATAPLSPDERAAVLPGAAALSDTRRIGNYFRLSPDGRFMIGGRGSFADPSGPAGFARLEAAMQRFYPSLSATPIAFRWAGRVAMTPDHLPHLHRLAPGLIALLGYNGRGLALSTALGAAVGAYLIDSAAPLPFPFASVAPMAAHRLHPVYASAAIWYYRLRDALET